MQRFDSTIEDRFGILEGGSTLVFIKTGRGGSIFGAGDKYLRIAEQIKQKYGYSVVVSANPEGSVSNLEDEIREIIATGLDIGEIIFIGVSNGALVGAQQGWKSALISRMLLINGPLMINWLKTKRGIEYFEGESIRIVYGEDDPSNQYFGLLDLIDSDRYEIRMLPGVDHTFSGKEEVLYEEILDYVDKSV